jgi:hypothetical protein
METPCLIAAAEILQREIYVVLLNRGGRNVLVLRPQSTSLYKKRFPFIIGARNNHVFLPLLEKDNNIRLLGTMITNHLRQLGEEPKLYFNDRTDM